MLTDNNYWNVLVHFPFSRKYNKTTQKKIIFEVSTKQNSFLKYFAASKPSGRKGQGKMNK